MYQNRAYQIPKNILYLSYSLTRLHRLTNSHPISSSLHTYTTNTTEKFSMRSAGRPIPSYLHHTLKILHEAARKTLQRKFVVTFKPSYEVILGQNPCFLGALILLRLLLLWKFSQWLYATVRNVLSCLDISPQCLQVFAIPSKYPPPEYRLTV